ncbi:CDP-diacylglycerol--serine O-phosphatidyltransferase [Rosettibacter firmus]|uniref:CDP-diacylglycerol--serine O-phosphatidyltransferase n=1 Tax=Rosettibacter firmus TaxID=3111522 RepID=UPI00336BD04E
MNKLLTKSIIANFITSLNIFCGFISIIYTSQENYKLAAIFIITAAIFDTIDGLIARLLDTSSRFGVELDSLSDIVSFGAAPSFLVYKAYAFQFDFVGIILSSFLLIAGAMRLARFNILIEDLKTKSDFTGLPIPLAALTISTLIYSYYIDNEVIKPYSYIIFPLIIILSLLMVSKIKYRALPKLSNKKFIEKLLISLILILILFSAILTNGKFLFFVFLTIVLFGIFNHLYLLLNKIRN